MHDDSKKIELSLRDFQVNEANDKILTGGQSTGYLLLQHSYNFFFALLAPPRGPLG